MRGRVVAGKDDMGGSAANRLTAAGSGVTGTTLGNAGGAQTHTLTEAQMPSHTHAQNAHFHDGIWADGVLTIGSNESNAASIRSKHDRNAADTTGAKWTTVNATATNQNTGGGAAHNITQPTLILNYIIKAVAF
jgi:microcystin-dependent protein